LHDAGALLLDPEHAPRNGRQDVHVVVAPPAAVPAEGRLRDAQLFARHLDGEAGGGELLGANAGFEIGLVE
jgi:hypothetical protein